MAIEIGSLVVRGTFGGESGATSTPEEMREELLRLRTEILEEVREMLAEADRRARER